MPHQAMADDEHLVLLPKGDVTVSGIEVVAVRTRMDGFPLQHVLRADGVELGRDNGVAARVAFLELRRIQCSTDPEDALICSLERSGGLAVGEGSRENQECDGFHKIMLRYLTIASAALAARIHL